MIKVLLFIGGIICLLGNLQLYLRLHTANYKFARDFFTDVLAYILLFIIAGIFFGVIFLY